MPGASFRMSAAAPCAQSTSNAKTPRTAAVKMIPCTQLLVVATAKAKINPTITKKVTTTSGSLGCSSDREVARNAKSGVMRRNGSKGIKENDSAVAKPMPIPATMLFGETSITVVTGTKSFSTWGSAYCAQAPKAAPTQELKSVRIKTCNK